MYENKGLTIWLTGMSGAGKSTLARYLYQRLSAAGRAVELIDDDEVAERLHEPIEETHESRERHVRRVAWAAELLTRADVYTLVAATSPYREGREGARRQIRRFVEVLCDCPVDRLIERDPKGLYRKALSGKITNFVGITEAYEAPSTPEVVIDSSVDSLQEAGERVLQTLKRLNYLSADEAQVALFGKGAVEAIAHAEEGAREAKEAADRARADRAVAERRAAAQEAAAPKAPPAEVVSEAAEATEGEKAPAEEAPVKAAVKAAVKKASPKKAASKKASAKKASAKGAKAAAAKDSSEAPPAPVKAAKKAPTKKAAKKAAPKKAASEKALAQKASPKKASPKKAPAKKAPAKKAAPKPAPKPAPAKAPEPSGSDELAGVEAAATAVKELGSKAAGVLGRLTQRIRG